MARGWPCPAIALSRPEDMHSRFATAFTSGNLDAILATLYEPEASLVLQPGQVVQARDATCQALLQFLALIGTMQVNRRGAGGE